MIVERPLAVVTPTLDGDVLRVLAQVDAAFTTGQIQALVQRASIPGLRRVLDRLVSQGIVRAERTPVAVLYSFNRQHLAAEPILALARLRAELIQRLHARLAAWEQPASFAALFGSVARGDMTVASDLDIFVVRPDRVDVEAPVWRSQLDELALDVTQWTGNDARILEYEEARTGTGERVLEFIAEEGIVLFGDESWLRRRVSRWAQS